MSNNQYKVRDYKGGIKVQSFSISEIQASYPSPLKAEYWEADLGSLDYPFGKSARLVCSQHTGGSNGWLVGNAASGGASQTYPDATTWRKVLQHKCQLAPGAALFFRVICLESGQTEEYVGSLGTWEPTGVQGAIRLSVGYENILNQTSSATFTKQLPVSANANGEENTGNGKSWDQIQCLTALGLTHPSEAKLSAAEQKKWSEWPALSIEIAHQGGARIIHASVWEIPYQHSATHTETEVSLPAWTGSTLPRPQIEDADGVTYEEHRFGSLRSLQAAYRQSQRFGAHIASWSSYAEGLAEVTDTTNDPVQVTSTSYVGLSVGSHYEGWETSFPGYAIHAPPNGRAPENLHTRMRIGADADGEYYAATIPVRCAVLARFTAAGSNTGTIKFQSSERSMVLVEIDQVDTYQWYEQTGWLEASSSGRDSWPNLMDFAKVTGGTMEVIDWSVEYGDYPI